MGIAIDPPGGGRRKAVQADLNLVPTIDLLTCMVAFLLVTAVWTQLARIAVSQSRPGGAGDLDQQPLATLAVLVSTDGFTIIDGDASSPVPLRGGAHDGEALARALAALKQRHPDRTDLRLLASDDVRYELVSATLDRALGAAFPEVSVADAASR